MAFKINVTKEETGNFGIVAIGKYEASIVRAKLDEFGGNYSIGFDVEIRSDVQQPHGGAKVLYNTLYLTSNNPEYAETTQKKVNSFFNALGSVGEIDVEQELKKAIGQNVLVYVKHDERDGKVYPKVKFVAKSKDFVEGNTSLPTYEQQTPTEFLEDDLPF